MVLFFFTVESLSKQPAVSNCDCFPPALDFSFLFLISNRRILIAHYFLTSVSHFTIQSAGDDVLFDYLKLECNKMCVAANYSHPLFEIQEIGCKHGNAVDNQ